MVFAADGGLEAFRDEEEIKDLFGDGDGADAPLLQPSEDDQDGVPGQVLEDSEGVEAAEDDLRGAAHQVLPDPGEPSAADVEDHRACGHLPYRSWCGECVGSRGTGEQHRSRKEPRTVCVFAFGHLFIGKDGLLIRRQDLTEGRDEVSANT